MIYTRRSFVTRLVIAAGVVFASELVAQTASANRAPLSPETAKQHPNVIRTEFYDVRGTTVEALLASMNANKPFSKHAATQWRVDWNYDCQVKPGDCVLRSFNVRVRVRFTLPQWVDSQGADKALQEEWNRYFGALQLHESGHAGFGIAAGKEMVRLVNSREWRAADQKELRARIDEECNKTLLEFRAREVAYDEKTDHGRTQGARLKSNP